MALKKKKTAEKENAERWLLTYANLITLLLVFFIVLYSMSQVEQKKFDQLSQQLSIVFSGNVGRSGVLDGGKTVFAGPEVHKARHELENTRDRINKMIQKMGLSGKVSATLQERGLVISMKDTVIFKPGSAELDPMAREIIANVGQIISPMTNSIRIEGHTDNDPIHTDKFFSNWELSTARSTNVLQFFIQGTRISPERLSAAGYGEYKPLTPDTDPISKARNRRVDIVLLSEAFSQFEPGHDASDSMRTSTNSHQSGTSDSAGEVQNHTGPESSSIDINQIQ